jgi:dihydropyrimidinase
MPLYVVHVSTAEAAEAISRAQARGVKIIGETLPGFLAIDASIYDDPDFDIAAGHVMSPPYRPAGHPEALWQAVEAGSLSITGTDHCCFTRAQKRLGLHDFTKIPNGCGGIEDRMNILWNLGVEPGRLSAERYVALTASNAAKIFNLWPRKGNLALGADADIAILDPAKSKTVSAATQHQNTDFSIWEGRHLTGAVVHSVAGGRHLWADGDLRAETGAGRYLPRKPFGPAYERS